MKVRFAIAPWSTMRAPTQRDADSLMEATCDMKTKLSRERLQQTNQRRLWNLNARGFPPRPAGSEWAKSIENSRS